MTKTEVKTKIDAIVIDQLGLSSDEPLDDCASFVEDFKADSLDSVEMVMEIEDEFGIVIPDDDAKKLQTIGQTVDYVFKKQKLVAKRQ
ncbi:MAG: acyl carrier protein [Candidatus Vogelbacteria bacterium]|nr:acyl carrier protein [Candidatus Vogelbacteria bacterium]